MKRVNIPRQVNLMATHQSIQSLQKITRLQYVFTFILKNSSSIYSNNLWSIRLILPENFPQSPPKLKFQTPIFHLNIDKEGWVSISLLKNDWSSQVNLSDVIKQLENILEYPDSNHPAYQQIFQLYIKNPQFYNEKCAKHLLILKDHSIVDQQSQNEIQGHINGLKQMKLTHFQGMQQSNLTLSTVFKNHTVTFSDNKLSRSPQRENKNLCSPFKKIEFQRKQTNISKQKLSQKMKKKKQQNIKLNQEQNIFYLNLSKKLKNRKRQNQCASERISSIFRVKSAGKLTDCTERNLDSKRSFQFNKKGSFQSQNFIHSQDRNPQFRPSDAWEIDRRIQNSQKINFLQSISYQYWLSVRSIKQIQTFLDDAHFMKDNSLRIILEKKLKRQMQSLVQIQKMYCRIKKKIISDLESKAQLF